ncbi:MAG TPA: Flp pilus assembly protein CpaB [Thermoanaerobaculia bacterium]|nr:Flp pilus assembly protein CpaB [Thermoanaerobaculia bacterium]
MSKGIRIGIALFLGLLAAMFGMLYLSAQKDQLLGSSEIIRVWIAAEDIPANAQLDRDKITFREIPKSFVQPQAITTTEIPDRANVKGVAIVTIHEGEQIVRSKLWEGAAPPLARDLKARAGHVGVSVAVRGAPHAVSGLLRPGNRVDVLASFKFEKSATEEFTEVRPLLQNIEVIAVNATTVSDITPYVPPTPGEDRTEQIIETVTLSLPPAEAQQIILAQQLGEIWLLMRAEGDEATHEYQIWNNERLLQSPFRLWRGTAREDLLSQLVGGRR